jgi:hypothetical protein
MSPNYDEEAGGLTVPRALAKMVSGTGLWHEC